MPPSIESVSTGSRTSARASWLMQGSIWALLPLTFYLALSPVWSPHFAHFRYDNARCFQLLMLLVLAFSLAIPRARDEVAAAWHCSLTPLSRLLVILVLGLGSVSAALSISPRLGWLELALLAQLLVVFLCVSAAISRYAVIAERLLVSGIALGAGFFVLQFWMTQALHALEGRQFSWVSPFLEFANARFFNQYQAYILLLLTLPSVLFSLPAAWRLAMYLSAANMWAFQWMLGGRALWAGLAVALVAVAAIGRRRHLRWLALQLLLVFAGGAIYAASGAFLKEAIPEGTATQKKLSVVDRGWESVNERMIMARGALDLIADKPLLGVGPGQFGLNYAKTNAAHPHNSALQLLSEYGLIAGGAAVGLGLGLFMLALRRLRPGQDSTSTTVDVALAASLILGLVDSLFSGNIIMPHSQVLLCVVAAWLVGRNVLISANAASSPKANWEKAAIGAVMIVAICVTTVLGVRYIAAANALAAPFSDRPPHFWQYGRWADW